MAKYHIDRTDGLPRARKSRDLLGIGRVGRASVFLEDEWDEAHSGGVTRGWPLTHRKGACLRLRSLDRQRGAMHAKTVSCRVVDRDEDTNVTNTQGSNTKLARDDKFRKAEPGSASKHSCQIPRFQAVWCFKGQVTYRSCLSHTERVRTSHQRQRQQSTVSQVQSSLLLLCRSGG
ncbi:hypothetical protein VTK56DRAFT_6882 [Thermocarpiscus australiensis]